MNAYVIYVDEHSATPTNRWNMYTVPGVDFLTNDDRVASLFSGQGERTRKLIGVVRLSENVSIILGNEPPQLGGFSEVAVKEPPPRPVVNALAPVSGDPTGATQVVVQGENFLDASDVFFGAVRAGSFTVDVSGKSITAISPAGQGTVHVTVITPGGTSALTDADQFTYVEAQQVKVVALQPDSGVSTGGDNIQVDVQINGNEVPQAILFGSAQAPVNNFVPIGPDTYRVSVVSPANRGDVHVTVVTQTGSSPPSPENLFKYVDPAPPGPPAVTEIQVAEGLVIGGQAVRIQGNDIGDASEVKFGAVAAESFAVKLTAEGAVVIDAISPCGLAGLVPVTVTTLRGTSATGKSSEFTYSVPDVLGAVSFEDRAVGAAGAPMAAQVPLKISLTDLPSGVLVPQFTIGNAFANAALQSVLQSKGLGPQFTLGQFIAAFGDISFDYAVSGIRLQRGEGRDFSAQVGAVTSDKLPVSVNFVPIAKGYRAELLKASIGGIKASGPGMDSLSTSLGLPASFVADIAICSAAS